MLMWPALQPDRHELDLTELAVPVCGPCPSCSGTDIRPSCGQQVLQAVYRGTGTVTHYTGDWASRASSYDSYPRSPFGCDLSRFEGPHRPQKQKDEGFWSYCVPGSSVSNELELDSQ